jgi:hypothetical protein
LKKSVAIQTFWIYNHPVSCLRTLSFTLAFLGKIGSGEPVKKASFFNTTVSTRRNMMRKLILFCVALALVVTAVPAMAQTKVNFQGFVKVFHENLYNFGRDADGDKDSDSFFYNKIQLALEIQPNEDISIFWTLRSGWPQKWGQYGNSGGNPTATGVYTKFAYAEVRQPWGTIQIGRLKDGLASSAGGLASLGYGPTWGVEFLYANPFDFNSVNDGVIYSYDFGNGFAIGAYYAKDVSTEPTEAAPIHDADRDRFGIEPRYQWDTGGISLGLAYIRDKNRSIGINTYLAAGGDPTNPAVAQAWVDFGTKKAWEFQINPAYYQNWGAFSIHFEGLLTYAKYTFRSETALPAPLGFFEVDVKNKGLGLYLDGSYNYGAGDITLMTWYSDGGYDEDLDDLSIKLDHGAGLGDFAPFLVAYNGVTLGNSAYSNALSDPFTTMDDIYLREPLSFALTNHWGIGLLGNHAINDDIKLNYGIGYFRLVEAYDEGASKSLGFELDLGATFQIVDNLSFETQFGYMFNGSAYKDDGRSPKDTFAWANVLAVTF